MRTSSRTPEIDETRPPTASSLMVTARDDVEDESSGSAVVAVAALVATAVAASPSLVTPLEVEVDEADSSAPENAAPPPLRSSCTEFEVVAAPPLSPLISPSACDGMPLKTSARTPRLKLRARSSNLKLKLGPGLATDDDELKFKL